jgi:BMFP domain-containing protein YqiC
MDILVEQTFGQEKHRDLCFELMTVCRHSLLSEAEKEAMVSQGEASDGPRNEHERDISELKALQRGFKTLEIAHRIEVEKFQAAMADLRTTQDDAAQRLRSLDNALARLAPQAK